MIVAYKPWKFEERSITDIPDLVSKTKTDQRHLDVKVRETASSRSYLGLQNPPFVFFSTH